MTRWEVEPAEIWHLYRDGEVIRDSSGKPVVYGSAHAAWETAENWEQHRAPTYAELKAMPDAEVRRRAFGRRR